MLTLHDGEVLGIFRECVDPILMCGDTCNPVFARFMALGGRRRLYRRRPRT